MFYGLCAGLRLALPRWASRWALILCIVHFRDPNPALEVTLFIYKKNCIILKFIWKLRSHRAQPLGDLSVQICIKNKGSFSVTSLWRPWVQNMSQKPRARQRKWAPGWPLFLPNFCNSSAQHGRFYPGHSMTLALKIFQARNKVTGNSSLWITLAEKKKKTDHGHLSNWEAELTFAKIGIAIFFGLKKRFVWEAGLTLCWF